MRCPLFRILAVDDDPDVLVLYKRLREGIGMAVDTAQNTSEALRFLHSSCHRHYGALITDLEMPGLSGDSLARVAKCDRNITVLMVTAEPADKANPRRVDHYFQKPLYGHTLDSFLTVLKDLREATQHSGEGPCTQGCCSRRLLGGLTPEHL